jgi:hypothetical protein
MARKTQTANPAQVYADHPITQALNNIAGHTNAYLAAEKAGDEKEQRLTFNALEGAITELLTRARPMSLDHMASFLALARGFAPLTDAVEPTADGRKELLWPADELRDRLDLLHRVLGNVIHGLCLMGATVHAVAVDQYANEDDLTAWANASAIVRHR